MAALASAIYGAQIVPVYSIMVYLAIIGSVAGWIIAAPNLLVALAKDKLFVPSYADTHPVTGTPYKAIMFQTVMTSLLVIVGAGNYETLLHLLVPMVLILYACVILSLIYIRRKHPSFEGYKAPGGSVGPYILILVTLALIVIWTIRTESAQHTLEIIASFVLIGIPIFLLMNFHHNPHASLSFQNKTAGFAKFTEKFFLPKKIRRRIVQGLTNDHTILFLSAGSGIIIKEPNVDEKKTIVLEHSLPLVKYLQKRFRDVRVVHDEHLISRIHPTITEMDCIVSVGLLSHIQDLASYLNHVRAIVPEGGSIRFFDYADFYKFIPNKILPDEDLRRIFKVHGFAITIERIKGIFWTYLIIQGIRTDDEDMVFA